VGYLKIINRKPEGLDWKEWIVFYLIDAFPGEVDWSNICEIREIQESLVKKGVIKYEHQHQGRKRALH